MAVAEVEIKGGSAHSTGDYSAAWTADKAFILGHENCWINSQDPTLRIFPNLVWYEFPRDQTFTPARVTFRTRISKYMDQGWFVVVVVVCSG